MHWDGMTMMILPERLLFCLTQHSEHGMEFAFGRCIGMHWVAQGFAISIPSTRSMT